MGGPLEQAAFCARVARSRHCLVLCVDYCTGPLHEYAAAFEDAEDVVSAVFDQKGATEAGRALFQAIYHGRPADHRSHRRLSDTVPHEGLIVNPRKISFSGFSSGATIALNLTLSTSTSNETKDGSLGGGNGNAPQELAFYQDRSANRLNRDHWPSPVPKDAPVFPVFLFYPQLEQGNSGRDKNLPPDIPLVRPPKFGKSLIDRLVPAYLPEHLRSHQRASPNLAAPSAVHAKARFFVVLPKQDSLNHHAYEWVKRMREAGWTEDRLRVFDAPRSSSGFAHIPEKITDRFSVKLSKSTYQAMMGFWSQVETTEEVLEAMRAP